VALGLVEVSRRRDRGSTSRYRSTYGGVMIRMAVCCLERWLGCRVIGAGRAPETSGVHTRP
jgi:hypothetical protein